MSSTPKPLRAAIYARVSTSDQTCENQLAEISSYVAARGWTAKEYIDHGVSGAKERRPALDSLVADARRRRFDALVVWRLDRLGRNLRHLVVLVEELRSVGVDFVSLNEGIDATTPAGKLQMHILGAIAEFERGRIQERVRAGLARARANVRRIGRPRVGVGQVAAGNAQLRRAVATAAGEDGHEEVHDPVLVGVVVGVVDLRVGDRDRSKPG